MTEGPPRRRSRWLPAAAVVVAVVGGVVAWRATAEDPEPSVADLAPVEVTSDAPRRSSLAELADAADLVVRAQVVGTDRGRLFGDPGSAAAIESRVVTLQVTRVLRAGPDADAPLAGDRVLVEEEGWTGDGAPLVVDGLAPSAAGDDAIWFLTSVGTAEEARYVVVSAEGRYLVEGDALTGAAGDDPLVAELAGLGATALEAAVTALP